MGLQGGIGVSFSTRKVVGLVPNLYGVAVESHKRCQDDGRDLRAQGSEVEVLARLSSRRRTRALRSVAQQFQFRIARRRTRAEPEIRGAVTGLEVRESLAVASLVGDGRRFSRNRIPGHEP